MHTLFSVITIIAVWVFAGVVFTGMTPEGLDPDDVLYGATSATIVAVFLYQRLLKK